MNTTTIKPRWSRHCAGCYETTIEGRTFEIRSLAFNSDGAAGLGADAHWYLFDTSQLDAYLSDFSTFADAKAAVHDWANDGADLAEYVARTESNKL